MTRRYRFSILFVCLRICYWVVTGGKHPGAHPGGGGYPKAWCIYTPHAGPPAHMPPRGALVYMPHDAPWVPCMYAPLVAKTMQGKKLAHLSAPRVSHLFMYVAESVAILVRSLMVGWGLGRNLGIQFI
jgi:hypothetical protein